MKDLSQLTDEQLARIAGVSLPVTDEQLSDVTGMGYPPSGFAQRTLDDLSQRGRNIGQAFSATNFWGKPEAGQQSELEFLAQAAGQGIGAAGDVLGNLAISGYREFVPQPVQDTVSKGLEAFGQSGAGQALGGLMEDYQQWERESPRAARNLGALGNIASVMPLGKATTAAGKGLKETANVFKSKVDGIIKQADKIDSTAMKTLSQGAYKQAAALGGEFSPKVTDDIIEYGSKELTSLDPVAKKFAAPIKERLGMDYVDDVLKSFDGIKGQNVNLNAYNQIDEMMTGFLQHKDLSDDFGNLNAAGQKIKSLQEKLRNRVLDASSDDIVGGTEGFEALSKARQLWSKQLKMRDLEEMIGRSLNTKQPNYALKKNFGTLLNKIETRGKTGFKYSKEEIDIIRKIAKSGKIDEMLSLFGSRLPSSIATGTGDFVTGMALRGASELPRSLATNMQLGQTQKLLNTIAGVPTESMGMGLAKGITGGMVNAPVSALNILGTGLQYRAPQLTALGLLQQEEK